MNLLIIILTSTLLSITLSQSIENNGTDGRPAGVPPRSSTFRSRRSRNCREFFRELDGSCTTDASRDARVFGSTGRPQFSYFDETNDLSVFAGLRSPREISNTIFSQTGNIFNRCGVSEMAVFFGQFVDHTMAASPSTDKEFPIPQSSRPDPIGTAFLNNLGESEFEFFRSQRIAVKRGSDEERASNALTSATDMLNVYGPSRMRNRALRTAPSPRATRGEMKVDTSFPAFGDLLPRNERELNNAPTSADRSLFVAGDHRSNEHPILAAIHTLFVREHNRLARELKGIGRFSRFNTDMIYELSKRINEIQFQKIIYEEWFPRITGRDIGPYTGFNTSVNPTLSLSFSTAGFRVGHTMVGPWVNFVDKDSTTPNPDKSLSLSEAFFNALAPITANGIDGFLKGAMLSRAQEVDSQVVDPLRNHLFRDVVNLEGELDLISLNLQRGRDHGIPKYNALRERFFGERATCFEQISTDSEVVSRLQQAYDSVDDVEAFPGMLAEDHVPGSSFGPTLFGLWQTEFGRLRDGDRFYFRNMRTIPRNLRRHPRVRRVLTDDSFEVFRQIILDNTNITADELPEKMFMMDGISCGAPSGVPSGFLASCPAS